MNAEYSSKVIYNENGIPYLVNVAFVPLTEEGISMIDESVLECLSEEDLEFLNELNLNPLRPIKQFASKAANKFKSKRGAVGGTSNSSPTNTSTGNNSSTNTTSADNSQPAGSTSSTGSGNNSSGTNPSTENNDQNQKATGTKPGETNGKDSGGDPSSSATGNSNNTQQSQSPAPAPQPQPSSAGTTAQSNTQPQGGVRTSSTPVGTVNGEEQPDLNTSKPKGISTGAKVAGAAAVGVAGALAAKKIMDRRKKKKSRYNDD